MVPSFIFLQNVLLLYRVPLVVHCSPAHSISDFCWTCGAVVVERGGSERVRWQHQLPCMKIPAAPHPLPHHHHAPGG